MTVADPYPTDLEDVDVKEFRSSTSAIPVDPVVVALNRIAVAIERNTAALASRPVTVQNAPLAALPPVVAPAAIAGVCPIHGTPWKVVPAGISKKTGKSYDAFAACSTQGCDQRPPR